MGAGSTWCQGTFNQSRPASLRYAIDRDSDLDQIFDIDADTGAIVTGKGLDRETAGWHNITVLAMEAGKLGGGEGFRLRGRAEGGQEEETGQRWSGRGQEQRSGKDLKPNGQGQP